MDNKNSEENIRVCKNCGAKIPAEYALHCPSCGNCYCKRCYERLALCECMNELYYYD